MLISIAYHELILPTEFEYRNYIQIMQLALVPTWWPKLGIAVTKWSPI